MLRASIDTTHSTVDLGGIADDDIDPLVPFGAQLRNFTKALVSRRDDLDDARAALVEAVGAVGAARAATTAGNFEMMNRLLDAGGVPIPPAKWAEAEALGLDPEAIRRRHPRLR